MIRPGFRQTDKPEYQYISQKDINKKLEKPKWLTHGSTADGYLRNRFYQPPVNGRMIFDFDRHKAIDIEKNGILTQTKYTTTVLDKDDDSYKKDGRKQRTITKQITYDELIQQNITESLKTIQQAIMDNKNSTEQGKKEIINALMLNLGRSKADENIVNAITNMAKKTGASTKLEDYNLPEKIEDMNTFDKYGEEALFYLLAVSGNPYEVAYKGRKSISIYNIRNNFHPHTGQYDYYLDMKTRIFHPILAQAQAEEKDDNNTNLVADQNLVADPDDDI